MEKDKDKILRLILGLESDDYRKSTLQLALKQARYLGGVIPGEPSSYTKFMLRRSKEGQDKSKMINSFFVASSDEEMDVLTSLSLYLIILDQLGHIFGPRNKSSNRVKDALEKSIIVSNLTDVELTEIAALRNSISHNFGLASYNTNQNVGVFKYIICFDDDGNQKPVIDAIEKWGGDWCDKNDNTSVHIYPFSFINYVEQILNSFVKQHQEGKLESPLSVEELKTRFTIIISSNQCK